MAPGASPATAVQAERTSSPLPHLAQSSSRARRSAGLRVVVPAARTTLTVEGQVGPRPEGGEIKEVVARAKLTTDRPRVLC
jgi:hypothetical protein